MIDRLPWEGVIMFMTGTILARLSGPDLPEIVRSGTITMMGMAGRKTSIPT
jgi:hypothetical protein